MRRIAGLAAMLVLVPLLGVPGPASAGGPIVVDVLTDVVDAGGDCSIREAVDAVNGATSVDGCSFSSPVIQLPAGTITVTGTRGDDDNETGDLDILTDVTILGAPGGTTIDGDDSDRIFDFRSGTSVLEGVTVQSGEVDGEDGGALRNRDDLTIRNCTFRDNEALETNIGGKGGAIDNDSESTLLIEDCLFEGNHVEDGGGAIHNDDDAEQTIRRTTFFDNASDNDGGAIENREGATTTVTHSLFRENSADDEAGAVESEADEENPGTLIISNSTFSGNEAGTQGGAMEIDEFAVARLTNVTMTDNTGDAGGIHVDVGATWELTNTIVAGNTGGDCSFDDGADPIDSGGGNIDGDGSCGLSEASDKSPVADVGIGALADNGGPTLTHLPQPGSPAIDMGVDGPCPSDDQRGENRTEDGDGDGTATCDIGAVEVAAAAPPAATPPIPAAPAADAVAAQPDFTG